MTSNHSRIEPLLNPEYWNRSLDDGEAQPWALAPLTPEEYSLALDGIGQYVRRGAPKDAVTTIDPGNEFDVEDYPKGTVLLSLLECLTIPPAHKTVTAMAHFSGLPLPPNRPTLADEERHLKGYGYEYDAYPALNVVIKNGNALDVCVLPARFAQGLTRRTAQDNLLRGVPKYTVGKTYNFVGLSGRCLTSVSELIVCMYGAGHNGKRKRSAKGVV